MDAEMQCLLRVSGRRQARMKVIWKPILSVGLYGYTATSPDGTRVSEVIRAYGHHWFAYNTLNGAVCKKEPDEPKYERLREAKARGARFVRGETTPEVWPCTNTSVDTPR